MGTYVAYIAKKLRIPTPDSDDCSNTTTLINMSTFEKGQFIRVIDNPPPGQSKYFWKFPTQEPIALPANILFELSDISTWLVPTNFPHVHGRIPSPHDSDLAKANLVSPSTSANRQRTHPYSLEPQPYQVSLEPHARPTY